MAAIEYLITPSDPNGHHFTVDLFIQNPNPKGQKVQLPAWIPGSYMIRDFSKHVERLTAQAVNQRKQAIHSLQVSALDSNTWAIESSKHAIMIRMLVYAFDTSVRTAFLDHDRAFFNPSSLCLQVLGQSNDPIAVLIQAGNLTPSLEVKTSLRSQKINRRGFGSYEAKHYDELIDHPVTIGTFDSITWKSFGALHEMVIQGAYTGLDKERLRRDLKAICDGHIAFFDPLKKRTPFAKYLFHVHAVHQGYGGLEHRSSTALLCNRKDLPYMDQDTAVANKNYHDFLGLCSHEYFHAWMVKKIQPAVFQPYQLQEKNHTRLLWLFEGFTSYYDDLQLLRTKRIRLNDYLQRINSTIAQIYKTAGHKVQSVADSSFDAWTKYYQADENTPNSVVSYYAKGSLVALGLDIAIRLHTNQQKSLDDVMRLLWAKHGSYTIEPGKGLAEDGFGNIVTQAIGSDFSNTWHAFEKDFIEGTRELPLKNWLSSQGYTCTKETLSPKDQLQLELGIRIRDQLGWLQITHVLTGGAAQTAGLSVGDLIVSWNQERVTPATWDSLLTRTSAKSITVMAFRDQILKQFEVKLRHNANPPLCIQLPNE